MWTERLQHLNETFLKPLRKSTEIARAHYKLEIKNKKEDGFYIKYHLSYTRKIQLFKLNPQKRMMYENAKKKVSYWRIG